MECDSRDMFLGWQNKKNVKMGLWKWKYTHISRRSVTVKNWKEGLFSKYVQPCWQIDAGQNFYLFSWSLTEGLIHFKIQTSVLSKVFFGRLTINLLVTKSEEFWSCGKKNQNMGWWPQSLGDKRKRQKRKWWLPGWFFFSPPCCCQQPGVDPSTLATAQKVKDFQCSLT